MAKKSVHLTSFTEQYITNRTLEGEKANYSSHINSAFSLLAHIAQTEKPMLTSDEWIELYNVYAGSDLTKPILPMNISSDLLTHYGATVPKQLNTTAAALADKLVDMTQSQQFAIIDAVRIFLSTGNEKP